MDIAAKIGRVSDKQLAVLSSELFLVLLALFILGRFEAVIAGPRHAEQHAPAIAHAFQTTTASVPAITHASARFTACNFQPLLPAQGALDGRYHIDAALAAPDHPGFSALMAVARDTARQQRARDAEVALIAACRVAERSQGARSVAVGSAQAKLAELYLGFAGSSNNGPADAIQRAHDLMVESLANYTAVLGVQASRTHVAAQKLSRFEAAQAQGLNPADPALSQEELIAASAASSVMGSAPLSFDAYCAVNTAEPQCNDPQIAQAEADLGRLRTQAAAVTRDPRGFEMRMRTAQASRASCLDAACVMRWYESRRGELLKEF